MIQKDSISIGCEIGPGRGQKIWLYSVRRSTNFGCARPPERDKRLPSLAFHSSFSFPAPRLGSRVFLAIVSGQSPSFSQGLNMSGSTRDSWEKLHSSFRHESRDKFRSGRADRPSSPYLHESGLLSSFRKALLYSSYRCMDPFERQ